MKEPDSWDMLESKVILRLPGQYFKTRAPVVEKRRHEVDL